MFDREITPDSMHPESVRGRRGREYMIVGFTTAYHH